MLDIAVFSHSNQRRCGGVCIY